MSLRKRDKLPASTETTPIQVIPVRASILLSCQASTLWINVLWYFLSIFSTHKFTWPCVPALLDEPLCPNAYVSPSQFLPVSYLIFYNPFLVTFGIWIQTIITDDCSVSLLLSGWISASHHLISGYPGYSKSLEYNLHPALAIVVKASDTSSSEILTPQAHNILKVLNALACGDASPPKEHCEWFTLLKVGRKKVTRWWRTSRSPMLYPGK